MPFFIKNINRMSIVRKQDSEGFEYPEMFVMTVVATILYVSSNFHYSALLPFLITLVGFVIIVSLSYRKQHNLISNIGAMGVMAMMVGSTQFYEPIFTSVLLLAGIRLIVCDSRIRISLLITLILTTAVFYLLSLVVPMPTLELSQPYAMLIVGLSIIAGLWQFWETHSSALQSQMDSQKYKQRLITLVSVISKLTRFMPPQVWKPIVKSDSSVAVFNKRTKLTILFSDIVGFTELSETLSADNLAEILNTYMQSMTLIANRHGAVLDKFIGDGMVCFFGEPTSNGVRDGALACVSMAIDMRREMRVLRHQWRLQGFEGLYVRIGIHTGYCHVGNFGSKNRLNYTLIGRAVNLTSRLESAASKGSILISQDTYDYVNYDFACEPKGALALKGFDEPVFTYQVLDPEERARPESKWIDQDLPGFNLQLNFNDIKNYDYRVIKSHLNRALEQVEKAESDLKE